MYCGVLGGEGVGPLVKIENTLKQDGYINLLRDQFLPFSNNNLAPGCVFQQDNALCYKRKKVLQWFENPWDCFG